MEVRRRGSLYGFEFLEEDARRVERENKRNFEVKQMWQKTHEICNLAVRGFKNTEIAELLSVTPQTVSNALNSRLGEMKIAELRKFRDEEAKQVSEQIKELTRKALNTYDKIFEDTSGQCSLMDKKQAADTVILELSGLRVPKKVVSDGPRYSLTEEELLEIKERGRRAAKESGIIIDVEPEPEPEQESQQKEFEFSEQR